MTRDIRRDILLFTLTFSRSFLSHDRTWSRHHDLDNHAVNWRLVDLILSDDITSQSWDNIADVKRAIETWILDRHEFWAPAHHNDKTRLQLDCWSESCGFHLRVAKTKDGSFGVITCTLHHCPPSTHTGFKERSSAWYLAGRVKRDVATNHYMMRREDGWFACGIWAYASTTTVWMKMKMIRVQRLLRFTLKSQIGILDEELALLIFKATRHREYLGTGRYHRKTIMVGIVPFQSLNGMYLWSW
jgi:hypothetical protein